MARKSKATKYNILIVCEGTNTEPNYFRGIREAIQSDTSKPIDFYIEISPKPPLDKEDTNTSEKPVSEHKSKRKKRKLRTTKTNTLIDVPKIEAKYKAVPVRYVREAQKGLEDGIYDEVWAVFDQDGHPKHKEAFDLAKAIIEGKKVNIALSSISFENWILLHFEANKTEFLKSECKENKKTLKCGTGLHPNDCYSRKCVIGYLRTLNYLPEYTKGATMNIYPLIAKNTKKAFENAAWLRYQIKSEKPIYELNPYTNMDILVKRLLQIDEEIIWLDFGENIEVEGIEVRLEKESEDLVKVFFENQSDRTVIIGSDVFSVNIEGENYDLDSERLMIDVGEKADLTLDISEYKQETNGSIGLVLKVKYRILISINPPVKP